VILVASWFLCLVACAALASAQETHAPTAAPATFTLRSSLKSSGLFSRMPDDALLFPDRGTAEGFWRGRLEPTIRVNDTTNVEFAVEQRVRVFSLVSGLAGVLPNEANAAFRIRPLDWQLAASSNAEWHVEIDRAALHKEAGAVDLTIGRQAIGWGRGALFGAIDLFAPFTPLEADREWRRGVDAVRADVKLADRVSVDAVSAFGEDFDHSAFAARLQGYAGKADVELAGGWRARDVFAGATTSAAVGPAELHAEIAVFRTPAVAGSAFFGVERTIPKAVAGGSYRLPVGNGVLLYVEYHYSGFGAASASQIIPMLADPTFLERYLRGDTQILGRHAAAVQASYERSPELSYAIEWLQSPVDGSGVVVPSATWTFSDRLSLLLNGYVPYGRTPVGLTLGSDYGATPLAMFVQLRYYR
jgi:hypothetical protein